MGIGKSRGTSPINVNDMLEKVEINQQIEAEKSEVDKLLVEIIEAKETLIKFNADWRRPLLPNVTLRVRSKRQLAVVII